jgi:ribonuclease P protein component
VGQHTLSRGERLSQSSVISRILREGSRWECESFRVVYTVNRYSRDRFAVLVSSKMGGAVARNRTKRSFREIFRTNKATTPPFLDIVIQPRNLHQDSFDDLRHSYRAWREQCAG